MTSEASGAPRTAWQGQNPQGPIAAQPDSAPQTGSAPTGQKPNQKQTYIYAIECNGLVKIGLANDIDQRLGELQVGNPFELTIVARSWGMARTEAVQLEQYLHEHFARSWVRGEWFSMDPQEAKGMIERYSPRVVSMDRKRALIDLLDEGRRRL